MAGAFSVEGASGVSTALANVAFTITIANAIAAGKLATLVFGGRESTATLLSVTDTRSNTWGVGVDSPASAGNTFISGAYANVTTTLQAGDTVVCTFSAAIGTGRAYWLESFTGAATSSPLDKFAVGVTSATTATTSQADEIAVGGCCCDTGTFTVPAGWTAFTTGQQDSGGGQARQAIAFYQILSATGTPTFTRTPVVDPTACLIMTFKAAAATATPHYMPLLGVGA